MSNRFVVEESAFEVISRADVKDFNPNHDPDNGEFTSGGGDSGLTKVDGDFTQEEKDQVREYQNGSDINGHLRDLDNPKAYDFQKTHARNSLNKKQLAAMDSAIAKSKLKEDTVLYRGVPKILLDVPLVKGETFKDPAYVATTAEKKIAGGFGDVIEIHAPAGTNALDVSGMLQDKSRYHQGEHILARGLTYRVDQTEPLVLTIVKSKENK